MSKTLMMIKPDAVERGLVGEILAKVEASGLSVRAMRMVHLTRGEAREFYKVHADKPFIDELVAFMSRSPIVAAVLEGGEAVARWRDLMGATNPANAAPGTIRAEFASSIQENAVHGSDSDENAAIEIGFFALSLDLR
jgi:nucleoside-diphosphate kinase